MDYQLQLYLIIGVGGGLIAGLILSNALLIYYLVKLYGKVSQENAYRRRHDDDSDKIDAYTSSYTNPALNASLDEELHRRFTQYTPEPTMSVARDEKKNKSNKGSVSSQNINVIDVTEEFRWRQSDRALDRNSKYNSNIVLQKDNSMSSHEGRTYFTERDYD